MRTITQHFETVIITAYIAKQKIIVERLDHSYAESHLMASILMNILSSGNRFQQFAWLNNIFIFGRISFKNKKSLGQKQPK